LAKAKGIPEYEAHNLPELEDLKNVILRDYSKYPQFVGPVLSALKHTEIDPLCSSIFVVSRKSSISLRILHGLKQKLEKTHHGPRSRGKNHLKSIFLSKSLRKHLWLI
jgi:hypothetical protein